jgi:hypothetical protein
MKMLENEQKRVGPSIVSAIPSTTAIFDYVKPHK